MATGDDFDVEDLLEEAFNKGTTSVERDEVPDVSPPTSEDDRKKEEKKRSKHRRSRHSRSRSRSRSPKRRHRSRERRRRSPSPRRRSPRRRSRSPRRSPRRDRRSHDYPRSSRDLRKSPSPRERLPSANNGPPMYKRVGVRSPEPEPPSEDRDRRTVMCMQLAAKVGPSHLEEFFQKVGQVREVKMIADKNSRKSKGIAYVEFHAEASVMEAMKLTGQRVFGVPIIVQPTMAEKNRLAAQAQNLMKQEGPRKLYVGSLHYNITDEMLRRIFEPFGQVEKMEIQRDDNGQSKGFGFVEFKDSDSAERAMSSLNGFEIAGRPIKVNHVTEHAVGGGGGGAAMETLDSDEFIGGVGMSLQSRVNLMAKLSEGHNAGIAPKVGMSSVSTCFMLSNMFDPTSETEPGWEGDIRDDVLEECNAFGPVLHIHVDGYSQGNVYVKCVTPQIASSAFNALNGRFFSGKQIVAQFIPEEAYHIKFPVSLTTAVPLKPLSDPA